MTLLSVALLAGGEGRRMGCPKHLLVHALSGQSLLHHQCRRLDQQPWTEKFVVGLGSDLMLPGWTALDDPAPFQGQGPLAAVLGALTHSPCQRVAILPIDAPAFPPRLLFEAAELAPSYEWVTFADRSGREQWLYSVVSRCLVVELHRAMSAGTLAVHRFARSCRLKVLPWDPSWPPNALNNLNSPEQLGGWTFPAGPASEKTN